MYKINLTSISNYILTILLGKIVLAFEYCQQKVTQSQSSFLSGFSFLPKKKKDAIIVLYAFCRELDDIVDDCSNSHIAQITLNWWREELDKVFSSYTPEHPVNQVLKQIVHRFNLPKNELLEIIEGMQMDLYKARYANFDELVLYCHRVAGVVGQLIARILGFHSCETLVYADKLGLALQLTNIIRDIGEDARNGRIYLPIEDLKQFNVPAQVIMSGQPNEAFKNLMSFQINRNRQIYREAISLLPKEDKKKKSKNRLNSRQYLLRFT